MLIDLPQIARLPEVLEVPALVEKGLTKFQDIALYFGKVERQGRYLREAAERLGLVENVKGKNRMTVTRLGRSLLDATSADKVSVIVAIIRQVRGVEIVLQALAQTPDGLYYDALFSAIASQTDYSRSTLNWRVPALLRWLVELHLIRRVGERYFLVLRP